MTSRIRGTRSRRRSWALLVGLAACGAPPPVPAAATPGAPASPTVASPSIAAPEVVAPEPVAPAVAPEPVTPEPVAPARFAHADVDPDNDAEPGPPAPLVDCEARLREAGVTFKPARIGTSREVDGIPRCGAKQVVRVRRGPGSIKYSSSPLLTCTMALALADFERVAQEEAERAFGSRIVGIDHLGTFNCRDMALYDLVSEHSYANGLDLRRFTLANGAVVDVLKHFRPDQAEPTDAKSRFLRTLANRLFDEAVFSVVVTPFFDSAHRNHIHVDLARYRVDGSRP